MDPSSPTSVQSPTAWPESYWLDPKMASTLIACNICTALLFGIAYFVYQMVQPYLLAFMWAIFCSCVLHSSKCDLVEVLNRFNSREAMQRPPPKKLRRKHLRSQLGSTESLDDTSSQASDSSTTSVQSTSLRRRKVQLRIATQWSPEPSPKANKAHRPTTNGIWRLLRWVPIPPYITRLYCIPTLLLALCNTVVRMTGIHHLYSWLVHSVSDLLATDNPDATSALVMSYINPLVGSILLTLCAICLDTWAKLLVIMCALIAVLLLVTWHSDQVAPVLILGLIFLAGVVAGQLLIYQVSGEVSQLVDWTTNTTAQFHKDHGEVVEWFLVGLDQAQELLEKAGLTRQRWQTLQNLKVGSKVLDISDWSSFISSVEELYQSPDVTTTVPAILQHYWTDMGLSSVAIWFKDSFGICLWLVVAMGMTCLSLALYFVSLLSKLALFFFTMWFLLKTDKTVVDAVVPLLPLFRDDRATMAESVEKSLQGVIITTIRLFLFHCLSTLLVQFAFGIACPFLTALCSGVIAILPYGPCFVVAIPGVMYLFATQQWVLMATFSILHLALYLMPDTMIMGAVPNSHPYATGTSICLGLYTFGLSGAVWGPVLVCLCVIFYGILTRQHEEVENSKKNQ